MRLRFWRKDFIEEMLETISKIKEMEEGIMLFMKSDRWQVKKFLLIRARPSSFAKKGIVMRVEFVDKENGVREVLVDDVEPESFEKELKRALEYAKKVTGFVELAKKYKKYEMLLEEVESIRRVMKGLDV